MKWRSYYLFLPLVLVRPSEGKDAIVAISSSTAGVNQSTGSASAIAQAETERIGLLMHQVASQDSDVRTRAIEGLGALGSHAKAALPLLIGKLTDSAGLPAAVAIGKIDRTALIPPSPLHRLIERARMPAERDRVKTGWITNCVSQNAALDTLAALGLAAHSVIPELVRLTHRSCIHEHVVKALEAAGNPDATQMEQIARGLEDKDPEAREAALQYLSKSAEPNVQSIKTFARAMNDPNSGVRLSALQAMEEIHPEGEGRLRLLADFMKDPSSEIRARVLYMIGQWGSETTAAVPLLHSALQDPDPLIALTSAKLLSVINPEDHLLKAALIQKMSQKGSTQAVQAAQLLQSLNIHDAGVDAALEPYRNQAALSERLNGTLSDSSPEKVSEIARTIKVLHVRMASGIINDEPIHPARRFSSSVGRVYCWTEVSVASVPATLIHRWFRKGHLQHEEYLKVTSTRARLWSSAAARQGDWKVEIVPVPGNEVLATAVFTITAR